MKKIMSLILAFSVFLISATLPYECDEQVHKLSKAVNIKQITVNDYFNNGSYQKQLVNVIEADAGDATKIKPTISHDAALGIETLESQSQRALDAGEAVLASINCDMFYISATPPEMLGISMNTTIIDRVIYNSVTNFGEARHLPVFAVLKDLSPFFGHIYMRGDIKVTSPEGNVQEFKSDQFNRNYGIPGIGTFTRRINKDKKIDIIDKNDNAAYGTDRSNMVFYIISGVEDSDNIRTGVTYNGSVENIVVGQLELEIPEGCIVLSCSDSAMRSVHVGDSVEFSYNTYKIENGKISDVVEIEQCVGAFNWLVQDGKVIKSDNLDNLFTSRYARTGIGVREDGSLIAVTVDCRMDGGSLGMTMDEFAELFGELGAVNAINFDGGRSTQVMALSSDKSSMVRMNTSTDGGSRPISTGLLFISNLNSYKGIGSPNYFPIVVAVSSVCLISLAAVSAIIIVRKKAVKKQVNRD